MKSLSFTALTLILFVLGCKKKDSPEKFNIVAGIEIQIKSPEGKNLLDPNVAGAFKAENIDIFYLKNGVKERVFDNLMDSPENFRVTKYDNGEYYLILYVSLTPNSEGISTTYIEFNDGEYTDTVKAEIVKNQSNAYYKKIWYNDELKFDPETTKHPVINVIK